MEKIIKTWLFSQCRLLSGSAHAILLYGPSDSGPYDRIVSWPRDTDGHDILLRVAKAALDNKKAVIKTRSGQIENTGEPLDALACPLFFKGGLLGVIAIEMTHRSQPMQRAAIQNVQTGAKWLETMILLHGSTAREQLVNLVNLVAAGLEYDQFKVAATEVTNELAERFSCHRVSLGFMRYQRIRIEAMSHTTRIDQHSNLARKIRDAMTEALDQGACIVYPQMSEDQVLINRFHAQLATTQQDAAICTLPLVENGKAVGALLLERDADNPFNAETVVQCEQIGLLLGPVLATRRRDERFFLAKVFESLQAGCAKLFGPRHLPLKLGVCLTTALLLWLGLASAMLRISCDSKLEAGICRAVVAPQQGYIAEAQVRAGDLVRKGDLLAKLEDKELRLEQRKWQSQRAQLLKEYRQALASANRAEIAILRAKRAQAEAQLKLVEQQLQRTSLFAPFAGLVVKGDLSQALGSPVQAGEVLYEVAPTDEYRVVMKVDDRDIGLIETGQRGVLKLSGMPDQTLAITINRLTPVAAAEEGRNYFRVEAVMESHSDLMRPGMEGITKIEIGEEKLLWIWSRRLINWLRLFLWERTP